MPRGRCRHAGLVRATGGLCGLQLPGQRPCCRHRRTRYCGRTDHCVHPFETCTPNFSVLFFYLRLDAQGSVFSHSGVGGQFAELWLPTSCFLAQVRQAAEDDVVLRPAALQPQRPRGLGRLGGEGCAGQPHARGQRRRHRRRLPSAVGREGDDRHLRAEQPAGPPRHGAHAPRPLLHASGLGHRARRRRRRAHARLLLLGHPQARTLTLRTNCEPSVRTLWLPL